MTDYHYDGFNPIQSYYMNKEEEQQVTTIFQTYTFIYFYHLDLFICMQETTSRIYLHDCIYYKNILR